MPLAEMHRVFLQAIMSYGFLNDSAARKLHTKIAAATGDVPGDFGHFIQTINMNLKGLFMKIDSAVREDSGKTVWGLVNEVADDHAPLATSYSIEEIAFFKKLLEKIVECDDGVLSSTTALHLGSELENDRRLGKKECEEALESLTRDGWVMAVSFKKGHVTLGPRGLLELPGQIREAYDEDQVPACPLCKHMTVLGIRCGSCITKFHVHCLKRYFSSGLKNCVSCKAAWEEALPEVHEDASGELEGIDDGPAVAVAAAASASGLAPPTHDSGRRQSGRHR